MTAVIVLLLAAHSTLAWDSNHAADRASSAFDELQASFWSEALGLWRSSMWWQSANTVEVLANLGLAVPSNKPEIARLLDVVFNATANDTVARCDVKVDLTFSGYFDDELWWGIGWLRAHVLTGEARYLNRSRYIFDDIVNRSWSNDSCGGGACWQATSDLRDMGRCYKNAITNELFLSLGAQLAQVYELRCQATLRSAPPASSLPSSDMPVDCLAAELTANWAQAEVDWFLKSGLINGSHLINDGLDTFDNHEEVCMNNRHTAYTYNQGVLLSGLGLLWSRQQRQQREQRASRREVWAVDGFGSHRAASSGVDLLQLAASIVEAVWSSPLVYKQSGGVLREMDEPLLERGTLPNLYDGNPGTDGLQFKSVLLRHLRYLVDAVLDAGGGSEDKAQAAIAAAGGNLTIWRRRIAQNADTIWEKAACARAVPYAVGAAVEVPPLFGYLWTGPCAWAFGGPSATTQTSALDVFVADIW